jgi:hypothetical protein
MPIVFNDLGNPTGDPCGFIVGEQCDGAQYGSWHRAMSQLSAKLALVELDDGDTARRALATAFRSEFQVYPPPSNLILKLAPAGQTRSLAALVQRSADLVHESAAAELPPALLKQAPKKLASGPGFFSGLSWGTVLGVGGVLGALWYAQRKGWWDA